MKPYSVNCGYTPLSLIRGKRAPRHAYRPTKKKITVLIPGLWAGLSFFYLEYTQPRGKARVYRFDIHRKSLRPEVVKIECQFSNGLYKIIEMFMLQKYA